LKYFQQYDASTGAKQTVSGAFKDLQHLIKLINRLEGYTVTFNEIRGQALMLQIGSKCCEKSCTFVFLGVFEEWEKEQEICYMLSRLGRTWKGFWIFDAIVRPDHCVKEIKKFLKQENVFGEEIQPVQRDQHNQHHQPISSQTGVKRGLHADAPTTQEQKRSNTSGSVGDAPSKDVGLEQSDSVSTGATAQVLPQVSAAGRDGAAAASASASASEEAGSGAGTASSGAAARGEGVFSSQLLADVLCAALPTKVAMRDFVQAVKAKNEAFKSVQLSSKADGSYNNSQIAERIAECKPDQVTAGEELLSWLIKVRAVVACA
jgi:hypothetical protein